MEDMRIIFEAGETALFLCKVSFNFCSTINKMQIWNFLKIYFPDMQMKDNMVTAQNIYKFIMAIDK
jgi:hypothetical protein